MPEQQLTSSSLRRTQEKAFGNEHLAKARHIRHFFWRLLFQQAANLTLPGCRLEQRAVKLGTKRRATLTSARRATPRAAARCPQLCRDTPRLGLPRAQQAPSHGAAGNFIRPSFSRWDVFWNAPLMRGKKRRREKEGKRQPPEKPHEGQRLQNSARPPHPPAPLEPGGVPGRAKCHPPPPALRRPLLPPAPEGAGLRRPRRAAQPRGDPAPAPPPRGGGAVPASPPPPSSP